MKIRKSIWICLIILLVFSQNYFIKTDCFAKEKEIEFTEHEKLFIKNHPIVKLGVDPSFYPYEFIDSDNQYKGIAADYIKLISEKTGIQMEIQKGLTWSEAYEKAVEKQIDILPCVSKTNDREQYFTFSDPYYTFQRVIIVKENNTKIRKFEDLIGKKVAVQKDSSHHSYLKEFSTIELSLYPSVEAALEAVAEGKETAFVGNLATSGYLIKANGLTGLKYIKIDSGDNPYLYFAVRKDWPELTSIINKALKSITEEEKIEINNNWIGMENKIDYSMIIRIFVMIAIIIVISFLWILRLKKEIAKRNKVQEELKIAKEEAETANQIKSLFLARMSHEIRTPLNAITGMAYLLKKTEITATQKIYLDKITHASSSVLGIINDILDFSKIEAGKVEIERISFDLDKVLQQVISIVSYRISEQGIGFSMHKDPSLPNNYYGDPTRIQQILLNVINNAIKFTETGEVSVGVRLIACENEIYHIEFSIKDTGIGMTDQQIHQLFKPFDQGDSSINRRFGGTGLGLSIVKSLVDLMGGQIQVYSTPGKGSTFIIQLALEADKQKDYEDKKESASAYFKDIRALVLEKNISYLNLIEEYLKSFNIPAEYTQSESKALQILQDSKINNDKPFNLLILDYDTPIDGGIEFIEKIRKDPFIPVKPKFILMIPLLREDLFEKIDKLKIDFGIIKPIIPSVLYNGIIEIFKDKVMEKHADQSQLNQKNKLTADHPYNLLIVEDNKTNQFIAKSILEQAGFRVCLAGNGQEGYDFFTAHRQEVDLILMDLHMPILNGYEAAAMIRKTDESIPIVAMTADAIVGVEEKCKSAGIDYYVSKPFEPEQFISTIIKILEPAEPKCSEIINNNEEMIIKDADALNRLGNNVQLYQMVLGEYYNENIDTVSKLENALKDKNYQEAVQIVHKVKGSSGNIGAKKLYDTASEFQKCLSREDEAEINRLSEQFKSILEKVLKEILEKVPDLRG